MPKVKDKRILKASREKQLVISKKETVSWFLKRKFAGQSDWHEIFKVKKNKNLQPMLLYPARLSFRIEEFPRQEKLKEFVTIKPVLQEMLKGVK